MPRLVIPYYTVIRDTREQEGHGWFFDPQPLKSKPPKCIGTIIKKLDTGDYSVKGYEDILTIERKYDFSEIWENYGNRKRFEREMERMSKFRYAYLLIETHLTKEALKLSPPQFRTKAPGKALTRWLVDITMKYGVHVWFVGDCGRSIAKQIMEKVVHLEHDRWIDSNERRKQEETFKQN
jgi:hypothetical protein